MSHATAVIAAAGSGQRLGAGGPKAFVPLGGHPLLAWSLVAFDRASSIDSIVIAAPPGDEERAAEIAADAGVPAQVVPGAGHRSESVAAALREVDSDLVAVHDAARPLVTPELIDAVLGRLVESGADCVLAASPVTDTIKRAGRDLSVEETVPRSSLWAAQTPQAFRTEALRSALASGDLATASDDASLVEAAGGRVLVHEAPASNIKVTTTTDLAIAERLSAEGSPG